MEVLDEGCLFSASFVILVNGNAKGWVKAFKDLRQGDLLSPFLFTIVADVLSRLIVRGEERGVFVGFLVIRDRTRVSYLQFTDDTIFFSWASLEGLQSLKLILLVFGHLSRLRINLNKNTLFGIHISQSQIVRLVSLLDCAVFDWPLTYLGFPLGGNLNSISFWDPKLVRDPMRLDG